MKPSLKMPVLRLMACVAICGSLAACSSVTMREKGTAKLSGDPTYEQSEPFFLYGLIGKKDVQLASVCGDKKPAQWQAQNTFLDGFLGAITLGIYTPRSVRVWCQ